MVKTHRSLFLTALCLGIALVLPGCGGSGYDAPSGAQQETAPAAVEGIAAAGSPLTGTVRLRDSSHPVREAQAAVTQDGSFSVKVSGMQAPFLLTAQDAAGHALYSFAQSPGMTHINPLTTLAVYAAAGARDPGALSDIFENHNLSTMQGIAAALPAIRSQLSSTLAPLLTLYGAAEADPFAGTYAVNHQGLDGLFDQVAFAVADGRAVLTGRDTSAVIFAAPVIALSSGTLTTAALPTPKNYSLPGNAVLTLAVRGELPAASRIKSLALSLKLPLGVTADQGASGINTAIPVESAAGSNVYPPPSLSSANTTLKITMSSLAGFTTGDFMKVRLIVSSEALLSTAAGDFSVASASLYSDIYKNDRLKGLTVVPVSVTFPTREGKSVYEARCARCHTLVQSDSAVTPSLFRKTDQVAERLKQTHHTVTLTSGELENLIAYLTAYFSGQRVF